MWQVPPNGSSPEIGAGAFLELAVKRQMGPLDAVLWLVNRQFVASVCQLLAVV